MAVAPSTTNLLPPPRLTGNPQDDLVALNRWLRDLYQFLAIAPNIGGEMNALINEAVQTGGAGATPASELKRISDWIAAH
jgi:hypothetical protein